jgi:hypothetical protein
MAIQAADIADLLNVTESEMGRMKAVDLAQELREYIAWQRILTRKNIKFEGGDQIELTAITGYDDNARNVGLFDVDNVNQVDGTTTGSLPWRHTQTGATLDVRQKSMNMGRNQLIDFAELKRHQMLGGLAELHEDDFWDEPASSTDDTTPYGMKYWLTYNATTGFNGGNNTNFSSGPGNIDCDTYAGWKNYTFKYTNITKDDLIRSLRRAFTMVGWTPVIQTGIERADAGAPRYELYASYDTVYPMEELAEDQNDSLGNDLASKDGQVLVRRTPMTEVPWLTENESTALPVVGLDWSTFEIVGLRGRCMVRDPWHKAPNQHNVRQTFLDCSWNLRMTNRRKNFLGAKSDWSA